MNKFFQRPTGKENLTPRGWHDKWHYYIYGDAHTKQGTRYKNVFLDDFKKIKKSQKLKNISVIKLIITLQIYLLCKGTANLIMLSVIKLL